MEAINNEPLVLKNEEIYNITQDTLDKVELILNHKNEKKFRLI